MQNVVEATNHTFDLFTEYYKNIRNIMKKDSKGRFVDPFGNVIRSLKMDQLGNITGLYVGPDFGDSGIVLYGSPDDRFHIQANDNGDMYAYTFDHGVLIEERISNRSGYRHAKYSLVSEGHPVWQTIVHHGGPFVEKQWTEDGKKLIYKKTQSMDQNCVEKTTREFVDGKGNPRLQIDWRKHGCYYQTQMFAVTSDGPQLQWQCEKDFKGDYCFYDENKHPIHTIINKDGKPQRVPAKHSPQILTR